MEDFSQIHELSVSEIVSLTKLCEGFQGSVYVARSAKVKTKIVIKFSKGRDVHLNREYHILKRLSCVPGVISVVPVMDNITFKGMAMPFFENTL